MGKSIFHVSKGGLRHNGNNGKRASCSSGSFITAPTSDQQVDANQPVNFVWDSSCLNASAVDIYLYAPYSSSSSLIQIFEKVSNTDGTYNTTLKPKWWNSTASVSLQLKMVESGEQIFQATLPPGPIWTANYNASVTSADTSSSNIGTMTSSDSNITEVNNLGGESGGISKGGIAAAVLVPLIVLGLALGVYIKYQRAREAKTRKRWSEKVDQRMSTISIDWRAMSTKGAEAAIRSSMAVTDRASIWAGPGAPRPSSTFAVEGTPSDVVEPAMAQIRRPGVGLRNPALSTAGAPRASRISFAPDTRFSAAEALAATPRGRASSDTRRSAAMSRAFHSTYIPPVPSRLSEYVNDGHASSDSGSDDTHISSGVVSPTQREGPHDLSDADIHAVLANANASATTPSPIPLQIDTAITSVAVPESAPSLPPAAALRSPISNAMPMAALFGDADTASPDAVLRAYAERRRTGGSVGGVLSPTGTPVPQVQAISVPQPVMSPGATPMRALYSPGPMIPEQNASTTYPSADMANPFLESVTMRYEDDDAYFGTAQ